MGRVASLIVVAVAALAVAAPTAAAPAPQPYQANDGKGFYNVLPPGQSGHASGFDILAFLSSGQRPPL